MGRVPRQILPERLRMIRDMIIGFVRVNFPELSQEDIAQIFKVNKGTVSRVLDNEVEEIINIK